MAIFMVGCVGGHGARAFGFAFAPHLGGSVPPSPGVATPGSSLPQCLDSVISPKARRRKHHTQGELRCSSCVGSTARKRTRASTALSAVPEGGEGASPSAASDAGEKAGQEQVGDGVDVDGDDGESGVVNPFKLAFDAGRNLRASVANTLEQITGTASPVSDCPRGRGGGAASVWDRRSWHAVIGLLMSL